MSLINYKKFGLVECFSFVCFIANIFCWLWIIMFCIMKLLLNLWPPRSGRIPSQNKKSGRILRLIIGKPPCFHGSYRQKLGLSLDFITTQLLIMRVAVTTRTKFLGLEEMNKLDCDSKPQRHASFSVPKMIFVCQSQHTKSV